MTDTIEPTEEQRDAAVKHHYKLTALPEKGYLTDWVRTGDASGRAAFDAVVSLARLLAEREHKLRAEIARGTVWDSNAPAEVIKAAEEVKGLHHAAEKVSADLDAARAEVARLQALNAEPVAHPELDAARARIASDAEEIVAMYELEARLRARIAELEALKLHHDLQAEVLKAERDAATARVAELERPNWLTTPTRSTRSRAERLKEALAREEALLARVAELEASEPNVLLQRAYLLACNERNEVLEREAAHLAHIKALHQFLGDREEQEGIWIPRAEFKDIPKHDNVHYDVEGGEG
jgi:hypothetical protein